MTKKQKIILGLVLIAVFFFSFNTMLNTRIGDTTEMPLGGAVREVIAPFQQGVTTVTTAIGRVMGYFNDNEFLRQQNKELAENIVCLEEEVYSLKEKELENQRLLLLLQYKEEKEENYNLAMAKVIGRNHANWYETLLVSQGSKHGIYPGMVVVNHDGLIGSVITVTKNTAEVLLVLDREGAVGARIFENRHTPGVVVGTSNSQYLQMIHLPHDLSVEPNQTVVTSGLSGVYPPGIRIGKVIEVLPEPGGLMKRATLKPFVDFSRLEEVFIIKQVKTSEEVSVVKEDTEDSALSGFEGGS